MSRSDLNPLELGFDEMKFNTPLAKEYTKRGLFQAITPLNDVNTDKTYTDAGNNKIIETKSSVLIKLDASKHIIQLDELSDVCLKLKKLAKVIEENITLFAELEYLLRDIPMDDTKNVDVKLINQNFKHVASEGESNGWLSFELFMAKETPLFFLGCVAMVLSSYSIAVIVAAPEVAVVCTLFTELCHSVGLTNVYMVIRNGVYDVKSVTVPEFQEKGVAVITEKSDLDSAIDSVVLSSTRYPWRLRQILVQESVLEQFSKILAFKSQLKNQQSNLQGDVETEIRTKSSEVFLYNDKVFMINSDYINDEKFSPSVPVYVSAYRTNKDLLNLIKNKKYPSNFISLWCNDMSETNEIIHNLKPYLTWVNGFNSFEGPNIGSQVVYLIIVRYVSASPVSNLLHNKLSKVRESWLKLSLDDRRDTVCNAIRDLPGCKDLYARLRQFQHNSFVDFRDSTVCFGQLEPVGFMCLTDPFNCYSVINSVIHGNAIWVRSDNHKKMFESLEKEGAPVDFSIIDSDTVPGLGKEVIYYINTLYVPKIVYQNFGTIFAN